MYIISLYNISLKFKILSRLLNKISHFRHDQNPGKMVYLCNMFFYNLFSLLIRLFFPEEQIYTAYKSE